MNFSILCWNSSSCKAHGCSSPAPGIIKTGCQKKWSTDIGCEAGKQEVTSLGRFDSSTASCSARIQHFFLRTEMYPHNNSTQALSPSFSMQGTDFYRVFRWLNFCYLLSNPSRSLLLINPAAQCLGHSPEITTRAVLSQIPSHIPEELNNHSYLSHSTPGSAWNLSLPSPPCFHRSNSPEQPKKKKKPTEC